LIFTRIYNRLKYGDKAALATHFGKSLEWISRLTRIGGEDCPAVKYCRWFAGISEVNPGVADRMHEQLCRYVCELQNDRDYGIFSPTKAAAKILTQAAETVNTLNDGSLNRADIDALMSLKIAVDGALNQVKEKAMRFEGAQPR